MNIYNSLYLFLSPNTVLDKLGFWYQPLLFHQVNVIQRLYIGWQLMSLLALSIFFFFISLPSLELFTYYKNLAYKLQHV